jgi:GT2 family glycosyltransferase
MFDTHYFMHFEDLDVCMSLKKAGWGIRYCPSARATHVKGGSNVDRATAVEVGRHFSASWLVFYEKWLSEKYPRIVSAAVRRVMGREHGMVVR